MARTLTPKDLDEPVSQIGKLMREARDAAGLSRRQASEKIGVDQQTIYRWETRGIEKAEIGLILRAEQVYGRPLVDSIRKSLGIDVPRGTPNGGPGGQATPPGARFPVAALLRLPDVRARLSAIQSELIELGATPEYEENVMRTLRDRAFLSRFAGGSADDQYTEAELLQAIDNIAESARRFLAGPTL